MWQLRATVFFVSRKPEKLLKRVNFFILNLAVLKDICKSEYRSLYCLIIRNNICFKINIGHQTNFSNEVPVHFHFMMKPAIIEVSIDTKKYLCNWTIFVSSVSYWPQRKSTRIWATGKRGTSLDVCGLSAFIDQFLGHHLIWNISCKSYHLPAASCIKIINIHAKLEEREQSKYGEIRTNERCCGNKDIIFALNCWPFEIIIG